MSILARFYSTSDRGKGKRRTVYKGKAVQTSSPLQMNLLVLARGFPIRSRQYQLSIIHSWCMYFLYNLLCLSLILSALLKTLNCAHIIILRKCTLLSCLGALRCMAFSQNSPNTVSIPLLSVGNKLQMFWLVALSNVGIGISKRRSTAKTYSRLTFLFTQYNSLCVLFY